MGSCLGKKGGVVSTMLVGELVNKMDKFRRGSHNWSWGWHRWQTSELKVGPEE